MLGGKRAAQSALANLVADAKGERLVPGHPMSVGELLDRWLDDVGPHRSLYTGREYQIFSGTESIASGADVRTVAGSPQRAKRRCHSMLR